MILSASEMSTDTYQLKRDGNVNVMSAANLNATNIGLAFGVSFSSRPSAIGHPAILSISA